MSGARETELDEPLFGSRSVLFAFESTEVAEPKALLPVDLRKLVFRYGSYTKAAVAVGVS